MSVIIAPSHPTPLMQHQSLVQSRVNVSIPPPHPTLCERSINILRKVEGTWSKERYNIPTPPNVIVASISCARSRECGRRNVNIPTPPHAPHMSVASTSCAWSREHGRGNVNIPTPLHSNPPHPTPCKLWGKWWALRLKLLKWSDDLDDWVPSLMETCI